MRVHHPVHHRPATQSSVAPGIPSPYPNPQTCPNLSHNVPLSIVISPSPPRPSASINALTLPIPMKLLLTSAGIKNPSIHAALVSLLGKPIAESHALAIPTASYGHPHVAPFRPHRFIAGLEPNCPMTELGWKSVGVLELTALPSIPRDRWLPWIDAADILLVNGGDALYLAHHMRLSGLADLLPSYPHKVWCGLSGGSMVMSPQIGEDFIGWKPPAGYQSADPTAHLDQALGVVPFSIFPHTGHPMCPENTLENAEKWAAKLKGGTPAYAICDNTAIQVANGQNTIISEGQWKHFPPQPPPAP